jgi:hypothetical protein
MGVIGILPQLTGEKISNLLHQIEGNWSPVKDSSAIVLGAFLLLGREIPSFFILEMRLVLGNPSRAAAPSGPPISQPVSSRVRKIRVRTESLNVPDVKLKVDVF